MKHTVQVSLMANLFQVVGTSKKLIRKGKLSKEMEESEGESLNLSVSIEGIQNMQQSFTPSTPPPTARPARRRKGVPHRAPMGGSL